MMAWLKRVLRCPVALPEVRQPTHLDKQVERADAIAATYRRKVLEEVDATKAEQANLRYALDTRRINRLTALAEESIQATRRHHQ